MSYFTNYFITLHSETPTLLYKVINTIIQHPFKSKNKTIKI